MTASQDRLRVLFVCTGNICRSPSAEGLLRARLDEAGLGAQVELDSAGLQGWHIGRRPDLRAINAAGKRGLDLRALKARQVTPEDFHRFDLILAMDGGHFAGLTTLKPRNARAELRHYLDFADPVPSILDVDDPYFGCEADFDRMMKVLETAVPRLIAHLRARLETEAA